MFKNDFIASVVVNNQIARELNIDGANTVFLPFGTEYSLRLKNHHNTRAFVRISIDGTNVLGKHDGIVIGMNEETDLNGFTDNYVVRNAFKFIEKTDKIRKHRGDRTDDGLVKIEFQFEKPKPVFHPSPIIPYKPYQPYRPWDYPKPYWYNSDNDPVLRSANFCGGGNKSCSAGPMRACVHHLCEEW